MFWAFVIGTTVATGWAVERQMNSAAPEPVVANEEIRGEVFVAAENELRFEKFTDGSLVKMFPGSRLQFDFSGPKRRINLLRGEAQFTVAKDPLHPFVVQTELVDVTAIGTIFTVRAATNCGRLVKVHEGAVRVSGRGAAAGAAGRILPAGESYDLDQKCPERSAPPSNSATTGK